MQPRTSTAPSSLPLLRALGVAVAALAAIPAHAQVPLAKLPELRPERGSVIPHDRMYYLEPGDGSLWARGAGYKVGFRAGGTEFVPYLGADAPRNFPVVLRVEEVSVGGRALPFDAAAVPSRAGDEVRFERGTFAELYELAPEAMEQLFVFPELPSRGELVVRIAAESDLALREASPEPVEGLLPEGLEFANELGGVRYGVATAVDASGATVPAQTTAVEGGFEIRVPAEFVAAARFPLTIDPFVAAYTVDNSTKDDYYPDVAYDSGNDRFLVTFEEVWSATDHDIPYRLLTSSGSLVASGYVDFTGIYWATPACANVSSADQFMVVAAVGRPGFEERAIYANAVSAGNGGVGLQIPISTSDEVGDKFFPDIGGDPRPNGPTYYLVVWERVLTSTDHDIHGRLVHPDGTLIGSSTLLVSNTGSTLDAEPCLSKSNDGATWNLVWTRTNSSTYAAILGARISHAGAVEAGPFFIDNQFDVRLGRPTASTSLNGTSRWIVAYEHQFSGGKDLDLQFMDGSTSLQLVNLTGLETLAGADNVPQEQIQPEADSDGTSFAVVYAESYNFSSTDYDVYVSTLTPVGNQIALSEGHVLLAGSGTYEADATITSRESSGGTQRRYMATWRDLVDPALHNDIESALYDGGLYTDFCHPAWDAVACPCSNPSQHWAKGCNNSAGTGGARIFASGLSYLSTDTMVLTAAGELPSALTIFAQGNVVLAPGVAFGQGVRCVGGVLKRLYSKNASGGVAIAPQGGDPSVHARSAALGHVIGAGETRAYYAFYRDPHVLGGCPAASGFNATQALQAIWMP